jgi:hypothetical protein
LCGHILLSTDKKITTFEIRKMAKKFIEQIGDGRYIVDDRDIVT